MGGYINHLTQDWQCVITSPVDGSGLLASQRCTVKESQLTIILNFESRLQNVQYGPSPEKRIVIKI
jgi:hypothetical protein